MSHCLTWNITEDKKQSKTAVTRIGKFKTNTGEFNNLMQQMKSIIIKPKNEILKRYVQYFLYFKKTDNTILNYTTFPNNNLCLAIYKQNEINYINHHKTNNCIITLGNKNFMSKLYGFHKMPFQVDINSSLDQVCIIFYPSALRKFTNESYADLMTSDAVFDIVFPKKNSSFLEQIFEEDSFEKRSKILESILLKNINSKNEISSKLEEALSFISKNNNENLSIESLAENLKISNSSLFRLFKNNLGQNPKSHINTLRFRTILDSIMNGKELEVEKDYLNQYYDQAHFINDFKNFTGHSPKSLLNQVSVQQNDLKWIYNKISLD